MSVKYDHPGRRITNGSICAVARAEVSRAAAMLCVAIKEYARIMYLDAFQS